MVLKNYSNYQKISLFILYFIFIILSFTPFVTNTGTITVKISGVGAQYILGDNFTECPDSIYLNNELKNIDGNDCRIINIPEEGPEENTIKIGFNRYIYDLKGMFANLSNILEVDFTDFDSTSVLLMRDMFMNCVSLTSIKLSNLNTASVLDI